LDELRPYELPEKFFLVLGRIDKNKNVGYLFENTPAGVKIVFAGEKKCEVPEDDRFIYVGMVSEAVKNALMKKCLALLMVSRLEAYSMVTAEALATNKMVIALKGCEPVDELIKLYGGLSLEE